MDYRRFLERRSSIWDRFESSLARAKKRPREIRHEDLEKLAFRYRQVLHDHALASFRFPGTGAARRLGRLALEGTHWLHRDPSGRFIGPVRFFTKTFPIAFRSQILPIAFAFALFAFASLFGLFVAAVRPGLGVVLLGVDALDGLKEGKLWTDSILTTLPHGFTSSAIATNNMTVAISGWAGGSLAGLGSIYIVLLNGFMLGAIMGVTWHYEMLQRLLEFVSAHGPLEITLILVTAGAGLGIGRALVEAGDRPRREAIPEAAREALVVLLGCLPWFLLLGVVETFISPSTALPASFKVSLGLALEVLFLMLAFNPFLEREVE